MVTCDNKTIDYVLMDQTFEKTFQLAIKVTPNGSRCYLSLIFYSSTSLLLAFRDWDWSQLRPKWDPMFPATFGVLAINYTSQVRTNKYVMMSDCLSQIGQLIHGQSIN